MRIIEIAVINEFAYGDGVFAGVRGSHGDVALRLVFNEMWQGLAKKITFFDADGENPIGIPLTNIYSESENVYMVIIPPETKAKAGIISATVRGTELSGGTEARATLTAMIYFTVGESIWSEGNNSTPVTATEAEQLLNAASTAVAVARSVRNDADSGTFDGEKGEKGDKGDKGDTGERGADGQNGRDGVDGYTPQREIDYWTDEDKAEIKAYVDEAILGGAW